MLTAEKLAGFSRSEADSLRKIIGKKRDQAEFDKYKGKFIENASNYIDELTAIKMWEDFVISSLYMFNESHSVGYSMLSYNTMWLKHYYPTEFIWSCLTNETKAEDISAFLIEGHRLGINFLPPNVNKSDASFSLEGKDIRFGISNINGAGPSAVKEILTKRPYSSKEEFIQKVKKSAVKINLLENLEKIGAFSGTGHVSEFDHKKYYLSILNCPIYAEQDNRWNDSIVPMSDVEDSKTPKLVRGMVKTIKRNPKWFRIEMEDSSGAGVFFVDDKDADIKKRDYLLALVQGNNLIAFINAEAESGDLIDFINNEDYPFFGRIEATLTPQKQLLQMISLRNFETKNGNVMGQGWFWNPIEREYEKLTMFPSTLASNKKFLQKWHWLVVRYGTKPGIIESVVKVNDYAKILNIYDNPSSKTGIKDIKE
jgi:hypothetical protein